MILGLQVRILIVCSALVAGLSALSARLVYLQWDSAEDGSASSKQRTTKVTLKSRSGHIVDRNERIIAQNNPVTKISVDPHHLSDASTVAAGVAYARAVLDPEWPTASRQRRDSILANIRHQIHDARSEQEIVEMHLSFLANILTLQLDKYKTREELLAKIGKIRVGRGGPPIEIARDVSEDVADKIQAALEENRIQGVELDKSYRRFYLNPNSAVHVVGFRSSRAVKKGSKEERMVGVAGIEKSQSRYLAGKDGFEMVSRTDRSLAIGRASRVVKPPIPGLDVQLTLDLRLQAIVEEELDAGLAFAHSKRGTIVLMDPHTGEVLAMASRPSFNLNKREKVATAGVNFAVQAVYEPGSTFKIIATAAAMECGLANPETQVNCQNGVCLDFNPPLTDHHPYGWLSLERVLAKSSNIGTYEIAKMLGRERFYDYVTAFGFGQRSGIDLNGELPGLTPRTTNLREFASRSYGYAVNVTPLQVANAYCVIANGGKLMKPYLVKSVIMPNGQRLHNFEPEVVRQVISPRTARWMRQALGTVTEPRGTATKGAVAGFGVAGKTGTARKIVNGRYDKNSHVASFAGMLPVENPAFVCVVVVDDPQVPNVAHYGGTIAAPIFSRVAGRLASAMNIKPTRTAIQPLASQ